MPEIILHLPDGNLLHLPEGTSPETMMSAVRQYGDQQAATAQQNTLDHATDKPQSALARFFAPILPSERLSDYTTGLAHSVAHPIESAGLLGSAIAADPVGAVPVVGNVKRGVEDVHQGNYAGAAGEGASALLQFLGLGGRKVIPEGAGATLARGAGNATSAVGRGMEAVGSSAPVKRIGSFGAIGELMRGEPLTAATMAAAPTVLDYGGKGLQKVGASLKALGTAAPEAEAESAASRVVPAQFQAGYESRKTAFGQANADDWLNKSIDMAKSRVAASARPVPPEGAYTRGAKPTASPAIGAEPEAALTPQSVRRPSTAEQDNIDSHSSYGEGHVLPEALPTELRDAANDGLNFPSRGTYNIETGKLESPSLNGLSKGIQPFSEFSDAVDPIINSAGPDEASSNHEGLGRSRLTNSWKDWIQKRGQSTPGWPFKEIQQ